jgi:GNAT superfamily N-acetyltransferase
MAEYVIKSGYMPGAIGRIVELHGSYYHTHWSFGIFFEAKVAAELSEFLVRYDPSKDAMWVVTADGRVEGSIVIDGRNASERGAHLRWFIVSDALRSRGAGRQLLAQSVEFCRGRGYRQVHLWTFQGLEAARRLYEAAGFRLLRQQTGSQWGTVVNEQYYELSLV